MRTLSAPSRRLATLAAALAALGVLGACASSGDAEPDASQAGGTVESEPAPAADDGENGAANLNALRDTSDSAPLRTTASYQEQAKADSPIRDAVIRTGTISLRSKEVAAARAEIQEILDAHRGEVANEKTTSDTEGELTHVRVVARVPSAQFATTMTALEGVATTLDSKVNAKDVTAEVIDVQARVRSQEKSLRRIEDLLASAANLDQVIAIEGQLARRQADLDSLKSRLAWLKDRTSLSTITINLGLEQQAEEPSPEKDGDGFLAGFGDGWDALGTATTNVATATGAATPFLALGALIGIPVWLVARHNRRTRRNGAEPAQV